MPNAVRRTSRKPSASAAKRQTRKAGARGGGRRQAPVESGRERATQAVASGAHSRDIEVQEYTDVFEESASILSLVRDLEGQVDTAFKLKEAVEADLEAAHKSLSAESSVRAELETRVESLQTKADLADQRNEDVAFAEEERNKLADLLAQTQSQLQTVAQERDSLAERAMEAEDRAKRIEDGKTAIEAEVMNLKEKVADMGRLRAELVEATEARQSLDEKVADLSSRVEASDASNNTLEGTLAEANKAVDDLRGRLMAADERVTDLGAQLEQQQAANRELTATRSRLQSELEIANTNYEASKNELEKIRNALHDIRTEAARVSGRVRQRYSKPKEREPAAHTPDEVESVG